MSFYLYNLKTAWAMSEFFVGPHNLLVFENFKKYFFRSFYLQYKYNNKPDPYFMSIC